MSKDNERKIKSDIEKFDALTATKEQMMHDWQDSIYKMKVAQKEQIDQIGKDYQHEKNVMEEEMANLEHEQRTLEMQIPNQRAKAEDNAWEDIDKLEDKNKGLLLFEIEKGVKHAAALTDEKTMLQ